MKTLHTLLLSFGLTVGFTACAEDGDERADEQADDDDDDDQACVPGETQACTCPSAEMGAQACAADGASFEPCDCGAGDEDPDPTGDEDPDPTGSPGATECTEACSVDADCVDGLECLTFGNGDRACGPTQCQSCLDEGQSCNISDFESCTFTSCETACPYTNDGECDEPEGTNLCAEGSDTLDCAPSTTCTTFCRDNSDCGAFESCIETNQGWMCLPGDCLDCFNQGLACTANWSTCEFTECDGDSGETGETGD